MARNDNVDIPPAVCTLIDEASALVSCVQTAGGISTLLFRAMIVSFICHLLTFTIQEITNPAESIGITSCTGQFTPPIVSASDVLGAMVTA